MLALQLVLLSDNFKATLSKQPSAEPFVFDPQICRREMIKYIIHAEIPFLKFEDPYVHHGSRPSNQLLKLGVVK